MHAAFYATQAARLGITPEEMYVKYPVKIRAQSVDSSGTLGQNDAHEQNPYYATPEFRGARDAYISAVRKTAPDSLAYRPDSRVAKSIKSESERVTEQLGGKPDTGVTHAKPLGPFSGYRTEGRVEKTYNGEKLVVSVYGKEQDAAGFDDHPALTLDIDSNGSLSINGPPSGSTTFRSLHSNGWADFAKDADGKPAPIGAAFWTKLIGVKQSQLAPLLGEAHARLLAWKGTEHAGLNWQRTTGATGGDFGRSGAMYLQPAYHGSAHDFDKFSTDHIGSGEGAQAYGWGLYFAENPAVAAGYYRALADNPTIEEMKLGSRRIGQKNNFSYNPRDNSNLENVMGNIVVFDDSIVKLTHKDGTPVTQKERDEYLQPAQEGTRGSITIKGDIKQNPPIITLLPNAEALSSWHFPLVRRRKRTCFLLANMTT